MITPLTGFDVLLLRKTREAIGAEILTKAEEVSSGIAKDMFDYGKRCGHINGLKASLDVLEAEAKKLMGEDRPNDER